MLSVQPLSPVQQAKAKVCEIWLALDLPRNCEWRERMDGLSYCFASPGYWSRVFYAQVDMRGGWAVLIFDRKGEHWSSSDDPPQSALCIASGSFAPREGAVNECAAPEKERKAERETV